MAWPLILRTFVHGSVHCNPGNEWLLLTNRAEKKEWLHVRIGGKDRP
jgi:hypothetical protein